MLRKEKLKSVALISLKTASEQVLEPYKIIYPHTQPGLDNLNHIQLAAYTNMTLLFLH
jgi:hypothetical protein